MYQLILATVLSFSQPHVINPFFYLLEKAICSTAFKGPEMLVLKRDVNSVFVARAYYTVDIIN